MNNKTFDEYEAAILVYTALLLNEGKLTKQNASIILSKILRSYGKINKGIKLYPEYRSESGMHFRLYEAIGTININNKIKPAISTKKAYNLYINNPPQFYDMVTKGVEMSKEKDGTIKEADMNNIIFTSLKKTASIPAVQEHNTTNQDYKNKFSEWAKDNVLFTYSEPIIEDLDNISKILKKAEICNTDIFQIKSSEEIISIYRKLKKLPDFQSKSQNAQSFYLLALQSYHFFLLQQNK